ncbi:transcription elongation factor A N-terminal and central domain-containing protein 2-like [Tropilaelaps mercedesae]|uniref:Transcription elongation factor A N-terminal and central domain-containing protein 2-like n=1 Tax=Tropilaelaps mercedesae TaxID=418985 RepID=A0A1V9XM16_9ACAR|nr:transcription elongation factor A N-terminal and central domain-containing protein 2-like [Tropilaelaps mercedesae]
MDKFLVRVPPKSDRDTSSVLHRDESSQRKGGNRWSQLRLKDLQGVVILEDLENAKKILVDPASSDDLLETTLRELTKRTPGKNTSLRVSQLKQWSSCNRREAQTDLKIKQNPKI